MKKIHVVKGIGADNLKRWLGLTQNYHHTDISFISTNFLLHLNYTISLGFIQDNPNRFTREDSSASDDGGDSQSQSTVFILGGDYQMPSTTAQYTVTNVCTTVNTAPISNTNNTVSSLATSQSLNNTIVTAVTANNTNSFSNLTSAHSASAILIPQSAFERLVFFKIFYFSVVLCLCNFCFVLFIIVAVLMFIHVV